MKQANRVRTAAHNTAEPADEPEQTSGPAHPPSTGSITVAELIKRNQRAAQKGQRRRAEPPKPATPASAKPAPAQAAARSPEDDPATPEKPRRTPATPRGQQPRTPRQTTNATGQATTSRHNPRQTSSRQVPPQRQTQQPQRSATPQPQRQNPPQRQAARRATPQQRPVRPATAARGGQQPPQSDARGSNNAAKPPVSPGVGSIAAASSPGNNNHGCSATSKPPRRRHVNNPAVNNPARVPPTPAIGRQARLAPQRQVVPIRRLPRLPRPAPGGAPPVRLGIRPIASRPNSHRNAPNVPSAPGSQPSAGLQPPTNPRVVGPLPRAMVPEAVDRIDKTHGRIITIHKNPRVAPHPSPGCAAAGHSTMTYIADTSNRRFVLSFKRT